MVLEMRDSACRCDTNERYTMLSSRTSGLMPISTILRLTRPDPTASHSPSRFRATLRSFRVLRWSAHQCQDQSSSCLSVLSAGTCLWQRGRGPVRSCQLRRPISGVHGNSRQWSLYQCAPTYRVAAPCVPESRSVSRGLPKSAEFLEGRPAHPLQIVSVPLPP